VPPLRWPGGEGSAIPGQVGIACSIHPARLMVMNDPGSADSQIAGFARQLKR